MADEFVYTKTFDSAEEMAEWLAEIARLREREAMSDLPEIIWRQRAEAAEARVAQLEEALRRIEADTFGTLQPVRDIARRALEEKEV